MSKIYKALTQKEKALSIFVIFLSFLSSLVEFITITTLYPFLELTLNNKEVSSINLFLFEIDINALPNLGLFLFTLVTIGVLLKFLTTFSQVGVANYIGHNLVLRLYDVYISEDEDRIDNSVDNEFIANVNIKVNEIVKLNIIPFFLVLNGVIILTAVVLIGSLDFAYFWILGIGLLVLLMYLLRTFIAVHSSVINRSLGDIVHLVSTISNLRREIILYSSIHKFYKLLEKLSIKYRKAVTYSHVIGTSPRFLIEYAMLAVLVVVLSTNDNVVQFVSYLGALGYSVMRLMPIIQQIISHYAQLKISQDMAESVVKALQA